MQNVIKRITITRMYSLSLGFVFSKLATEIVIKGARQIPAMA